MDEDIATPRNTLVTSPRNRALRARYGKRTIRLSTKARETQGLSSLSFRNVATAEAADDHDDEYVDKEENQNERGAKSETTLQTLVKLVTALKKTVEQQNAIIKETKAQLSEMKADQNTLRTQNGELQDEIRTLRNQLSALSESLPSTQSWASIVANGRVNGSATGSVTQSSLLQSSPRTNTEVNCLRISTRGRKEGEIEAGGFTRYLETKEANERIRAALNKAEATKETQVVGVGTTKTGYIVRFEDQKSIEAARSNNEWLQELGNETKLVKPRFGVVVHRFPTAGVSLPGQKQQVIDKIMEENDWSDKGFAIEDVAWLQQSGKALGVTASLGIWFDTAEGAEGALTNGVVCDQRYIGSVDLYEVKKKRCHRCQQVGHLAWSCREKVQCKHCGGAHDRKDCPPGSSAKCADCGGPHLTGARGCPGPVVPRRIP